MREREIKNLIQEQLPRLISQEPEIRDFILRTVSNYYAPKQETESRFDQILGELKCDREAQSLKWWEYTQEQNRKWDESGKRFDKMQEQIDQTLAEIKAVHQRYDSSIGALGSRWGLNSEASFRNALKGILEDSFGVQVLNINEYDDTGEVFGRPDQVELDIIIKNGLLIICEIKSSMSKSDMYSFDRKVTFYEKRHQRKANRKLVICPMVDDRAKPVAKNLGIEVYSYADSVELN